MRLSKIKLSDISNNFSYYEFKSEDKKYERSFIEIQKKDNEVSIKVDIFSKINELLYQLSDKQVDSALSIIEILNISFEKHVIDP